MSLDDYVLGFVMAGGRGSRLKILTRDRCKPAIDILSHYRILDFVATNIVNTGIPAMLIAAQFEPGSLSAHVGNGSVWGFDRTNGKLEIISPHKSGKRFVTFEGTADSVRKSAAQINRYSPDIVLVLAADHIYTMDYKDAITYHKLHNADITIMANAVPDSKVSNLGIVKIDESGRITDFVEKPRDKKVVENFRLSDKMKSLLGIDNPGLNFLASMGNYIFFWNRLKNLLESPGADFARDIIPAIKQRRGTLYAYVFNGYWRDIGRIRDYFDCSMDFACDNPPIDLWKHRIRISQGYPSCTWVSAGASTNGVILSCGDVIHRGSVVTNSVMGPQVVVEEKCKLDHCVFLGADRNEFRNNTITRKYTTNIGKDSSLSYVILDKNVWIGEGVEISPDNGTPEQRGEILQSAGLEPYRELDDGTVEGDFYIEPEMGILVIGKQYGVDPRKPIIPDGLKC